MPLTKKYTSEKDRALGLDRFTVSVMALFSIFYIHLDEWQKKQIPCGNDHQRIKQIARFDALLRLQHNLHRIRLRVRRQVNRGSRILQ